MSSPTLKRPRARLGKRASSVLLELPPERRVDVDAELEWLCNAFEVKAKCSTHKELLDDMRMAEEGTQASVVRLLATVAEAAASGSASATDGVQAHHYPLKLDSLSEKEKAVLHQWVRRAWQSTPSSLALSAQQEHLLLLMFLVLPIEGVWAEYVTKRARDVEEALDGERGRLLDLHAVGDVLVDMAVTDAPLLMSSWLGPDGDWSTSGTPLPCRLGFHGFMPLPKLVEDLYMDGYARAVKRALRQLRSAARDRLPVAVFGSRGMPEGNDDLPHLLPSPSASWMDIRAEEGKRDDGAAGAGAGGAAGSDSDSDDEAEDDGGSKFRSGDFLLAETRTAVWQPVVLFSDSGRLVLLDQAGRQLQHTQLQGLCVVRAPDRWLLPPPREQLAVGSVVLLRVEADADSAGDHWTHASAGSGDGGGEADSADGDGRRSRRYGRRRSSASSAAPPAASSASSAGGSGSSGGSSLFVEAEVVEASGDELLLRPVGAGQKARRLSRRSPSIRCGVDRIGTLHSRWGRVAALHAETTRFFDALAAVLASHGPVQPLTVLPITAQFDRSAPLLRRELLALYRRAMYVSLTPAEVSIVPHGCDSAIGVTAWTARLCDVLSRSVPVARGYARTDGGAGCRRLQAQLLHLMPALLRHYVSALLAQMHSSTPPARLYVLLNSVTVMRSSWRRFCRLLRPACAAIGGAISGGGGSGGARGGMRGGGGGGGSAVLPAALDRGWGKALQLVIGYHLRHIQFHILQNVEEQRWHYHKPFQKAERATYGVQMWGFYLRGVLHDLSRDVGLPERSALTRSAFETVLLRSLESLTARYVTIVPSRARTQQLYIDIVYIVAIAQSLVCVLYGRPRAVGRSVRGQVDAVDRVHRLCHRLLFALALLCGPPAEVCLFLDACVAGEQLFAESTRQPSDAVCAFTAAACVVRSEAGTLRFHPLRELRDMGSSLSHDDLMAAPLPWRRLLTACPFTVKDVHAMVERRHELSSWEYPKLTAEQEEAAAEMRERLRRLEDNFSLL